MPNETPLTSSASKTINELEPEFANGIPSSVELPFRSQADIIATSEAAAMQHMGTHPQQWDCTVSCVHPAETVGDKLKRVYPEYYVRILQEMCRVDGPDHTAEMLGRKDITTHLLRSVFLWEAMAEGQDFWAELARREQS